MVTPAVHSQAVPHYIVDISLWQQVDVNRQRIEDTATIPRLVRLRLPDPLWL